MNETVMVEKRRHRDILSTRDLARIFRVNESSAKRWADLGFIDCFRTPGGHRRFTVEAVIRFAHQHKFELDPDALESFGLADAFNRLVTPPLPPTFRIEARPAAFDPQTTVYDVNLELNGAQWSEEAVGTRDKMAGFILGVKAAFSLLGVRVPDPEIRKD